MTSGPGHPGRAAWDLLARGRARDAARRASAALRTAPGDATLRGCLGAALVRLGDPAGALPHLESASGASDPRVFNALANAYKMLGRADDALDAAERALATSPGSPAALRVKASVLRTTGRAGEALSIIGPLAESRPRAAAIACEHADCLRALGRRDDALGALDDHAARTDLAPAAHRAVHIRRAQILDELDRPSEAFAAATRANRDTTSPNVTPSAPVIARWTRTALDAIPMAEPAGVTPVLVVGMPRSGTTLLERIIGAHPAAAGAGECPVLPALLDELTRPGSPPDKAWATGAARRYTAALARAAGDASHAVDKMPANVFALGLAERIVPHARVIHARRDPRDVCLSCYFQELNDSMGFTRDLEACARQHLEYDAIMAHWRRMLTLPWCEVRYEDLVADAEGTVRRVLGFLGLEYDEGWRAFHRSARHVETASWAQVTRPLYASSVGKWRRYQEHLAPMLAVLGESGDA